MMNGKKKAVIIHGRHCQSREWHRIVWGDLAKRLFGQIPTAIRLAWDEQADYIVWGTGASFNANGIIEAEALYRCFLDDADELADLMDVSLLELVDFVKSRSTFNTETQNTTEEMQRALDQCVAWGVERVFITSAGGHVFRCHQEGTKIREADMETFGGLELFAVGADTTFADSTIGDVKIVEPPHRGDAPGWQLHRYVGQMFGLMGNKEKFVKFLNELGVLLAKYGREDPGEPYTYEAKVD